MYSNISVYILSSPNPSLESIASISSSLISGGIIELLLDLSPLSASLRVSYNKFPYSNCANVIILPVCLLGDVAQGVYVTDGRIAIASGYGCDIYANTLENSHQKQHHMKILSSLCVVLTQDILFDSLGFQQRYRENPFALCDTYLMPFSQCVL